jgi:hypothetical protein
MAGIQKPETRNFHAAHFSPKVVSVKLHMLGALLSVVIIAGCTVAEKTPQEVGQQFQEGIQGRGKLVPAEGQSPAEEGPSLNPPTAQ